ncbi:MAG: hypothetical protein ACYTF3_05405 [Planctomycetota bacterium]
MRRLLVLLLLAAPACSGGGTIDFQDIDIAGVKVDEVGERRILTFLSVGAEGLEIVAVEAYEEPWTGNFVVRVPKPSELFERGSRMTLEYAGSDEPGMEWDVRPPAGD